MYKNGVAVAATALTFVPAGATAQRVTLDVGVSSVAAGDLISVAYTTLLIGNTPTLTYTVEISD